MRRPEIFGVPDPETRRLDSHQTWLVRITSAAGALGILLTACQADPLHDYIYLANKHGFGVVDVNIPKHVTNTDVSRPRPPDYLKQRLIQCRVRRQRTTIQGLPSSRQARHSPYIYGIATSSESNVSGPRGVLVLTLLSSRPSEASSVFLMGVGEAHHAILHILNSRCKLQCFPVRFPGGHGTPP